MTPQSNPFSEEMAPIFTSAMTTAHNSRCVFFLPEHLLNEIAMTDEGKEALEAVGVNTRELQAKLAHSLETDCPRLLDGSAAVPKPSKSVQQWIMRAEAHFTHHFGREASANPRKAAIQGFLISLLTDLKRDNTNYAARVLDEDYGVTRLMFMNYFSHGIRRGQEEVASAPESANGAESESQESDDPLSQFTVNLNARAQEGKIDPLIGRQKEVERAVQILCRRRKNNPLLVGEAGVGKTAIAEGLAERIITGKVPEILEGAEVYSLDMAALMAGTKYRGDVEQRVKLVLKSLANKPKAILFVDEIHTLIGAGAAGGGSLDLSNLLKPALSNGELRCMGATTFSEYRQIFEKDQALARRFQKVDVVEPSIDDTVKILAGLKSRYEEHHGVTYTDAALRAAVEMSVRFIHGRQLPDKAIDVIDEAGALQKTLPAKDQIKVIDAEQIADTVSKIANVPSTSVSTDNAAATLRIANDIKAVVFGQEAAAEQLQAVISVNRANLGDEKQPIGKFLFPGPTGVGKTETAKQLAATLGVELIRFDMSEYMERHSVARLIGAPPGYVGFDQGGLLTDAVYKTPHCVLLLDEIEKAHPDIYSILLQVMDHGTLTDNNGRKTDFSNVILIMTSNAGAQAAAKRKIGFTKDESVMANDLMEAVKRQFTPEFRGRLDEVIAFKPLDKDTIFRVVERMLLSLDLKLQAQHIDAEFTEALRAHLADKGFDPQLGARPMANLIRSEVRTALAEQILGGPLRHGGRARVDFRVKTEAEGGSGKEQVVVEVLESSPDPKAIAPKAKKKSTKAAAASSAD